MLVYQRGKTHQVTTGVSENVRYHCTFVGLYPLGAWELLRINVPNLALVGLYIFTMLKWWLRSICPVNMLYLNQSQSKKYPRKKVSLTQRSPWLISMKPLSTVIPNRWFIQLHQRNFVPSNLPVATTISQLLPWSCCTSVFDGQTSRMAGSVDPISWTLDGANRKWGPCVHVQIHAATLLHLSYHLLRF